MSEEINQQTPSPEPDKPAKNNKPVVIYIMILFIAAFLLMALSFFMHQRSNTEALGELQSSVNAMQEIQISQEQIIELQEAVDELEERNQTLEEGLQELIDAMGGKEGDLLLFAADKNKVVWDVLGALRLHMAKEMDLLDPNQYNFLK